MQAGDLRNRITIERLSAPTQDAFGEPIETWSEMLTRWADVTPLEGREFFQAQQTQTAVDHRIRIRYDAEAAQITPVMRVRYNAKLFDIQSVINHEERNEELHLMARLRT